MSVSPWVVLLAAIPILFVGERLVAAVSVLSRFNIPPPVVGGLLVCVSVLAINVAGVDLRIAQGVTTSWWNWLVLPEPEWLKRPTVDISRPFLVGFFACIGLNASWSLVKRASWQLPLFLSLAALLTVCQNGVGVALAKLLGQSSLLGLICGSISLTGGHGTALGFSDLMVESGYSAAPVVGVAAATFGLVAAGLLGGPVGGGIIRRRRLRSAVARETVTDQDAAPEDAGSVAVGIGSELRQLFSGGRANISHLLLLLFAIKVGAWVSLGIRAMGLTFPVYIGAMLVGITARNGFDLLSKPWIKTETVDLLGSICLGIFLSMAMMGLNLIELANAAGPMFVILTVQVLMMAVFARFITYNVMGRDYDAAVMAAGHCGFGLGATPAAVANMKVLVEQYGSAPRAFLILPLVGAFLIDFINALVITGYLNVVR